MWIKEKFFKYAIGTLVALLILFLAGQLDFIFVPIKKIAVIIFFPMLVSGFLYYLLRPLVNLAEKRLRMPRVLAILAVFLLVIGIFALVGVYAGSLVSKQLSQLMSNMPEIINGAKEKATELLENQNLVSMFSGKVQEQATQALQKIVPLITGSIFGAISTVTGIATVLVMVPFILFYLLRDDRTFASRIKALVPKGFKEEGYAILEETDKTLSVYIIGQAIIALVLGVLMYIGYLIIGMDYSLILAFFVMITSFIPLFGAVIGVIPALLIGLADGPFMVVKVIILAVLIQQLEGNFISPNLVGKRLEIHPLTLIILFLIAASLYGFVGMLIVVPAYAVCKVIVRNFIRIYRLRKSHSLL
ncbi:MAG: AI-2E family transporter [Clostridia bacterium]|nr:AI-2E family transporter [Clostridia bacterium]